MQYWNISLDSDLYLIHTCGAPGAFSYVGSCGPFTRISCNHSRRNYSPFTHRTYFPLSPAPSEITANAFSVSGFADGKHFLQVESCSIDFDRLLLLSSVLSLRQVVKIYSYDWVLLLYTAIPYFVDPFLCWWKFGNYQWCCFEYQHTICDYFFLDFLPNVSPEFQSGYYIVLYYVSLSIFFLLMGVLYWAIHPTQDFALLLKNKKLKALLYRCRNHWISSWRLHTYRPCTLRISVTTKFS